MDESQELKKWKSWMKIRDYFRQLLPAVHAHNQLFYFILSFSYSKTFKFVCCLVGFHLRIALNLLKYGFFLINSNGMACLSRISLKKRTMQEQTDPAWNFFRPLYKCARIYWNRTGFNLMGHDLWFMLTFCIFTTKFIIIMSLFTAR